jgi:hypothetical protein
MKEDTETIIVPEFFIHMWGSISIFLRPQVLHCQEGVQNNTGFMPTYFLCYVFCREFLVLMVPLDHLVSQGFKALLVHLAPLALLDLLVLIAVIFPIQSQHWMEMGCLVQQDQEGHLDPLDWYVPMLSIKLTFNQKECACYIKHMLSDT